MGKVGEIFDAGLELAVDMASAQSMPHFIGEKLTDATLKFLRETPKEEYGQTATSTIEQPAIQ